MLDLVERLRDRGLAVLMVSHNLNDVFNVADRIAVMYLGTMVAEDKTSDFDRQSVVEYMTTGGLGVTATRRRKQEPSTMTPGDPGPPGPPRAPEPDAVEPARRDPTAAPPPPSSRPRSSPSPCASTSAAPCSASGAGRAGCSPSSWG